MATQTRPSLWEVADHGYLVATVYKFVTFSPEGRFAVSYQAQFPGYERQGGVPNLFSGGSNIRPPGLTDLAEDGGEGERQWKNALRKRLLKVVGGDEWALAFVLDVINGWTTHEAVGLELQWERYQFWREFKSILEEIRWAWVADLALDTLATDDGFTIDARTGELFWPGCGFAVSVRGTNARLFDPSYRDTVQYLRKHRRRLLREESPKYYFGGWENVAENVYEFDLTVIVATFGEALDRAVAEGQSAVYDFMHGRSIVVDRNDSRRAA